MNQTIKEHNEEARAVWEAYEFGDPMRPPVFLGTTALFFIFNRNLNPGGEVTFESYCSDARTMYDFQIRSQVWRAEHIAHYCDDRVGFPEKFQLRVDLQNFDDSAYFGAPIEFIEGQVPDTRPILAGEKKYALFDAGLPDPLTGGWYAKAHRIFEQWLEFREQEPEYQGSPIELEPFGHFTSSGLFTLAISLRGFEFLSDIYSDPDYVRQLLEFLLQGLVARVEAHHRFFSLEFPNPYLFFVDDSIEMISTSMLEELLLPYYKRYKQAVTNSEHIRMHLCGDATRHFKLLRDELGVNDFDTGFPVNFGWLRKELGPEVNIYGGPTVMDLKNSSPEEVRKETNRILNSGITEGGRFILREGNNLAPHTPFANLAAMYETARKFRY